MIMRLKAIKKTFAPNQLMNIIYVLAHNKVYRIYKTLEKLLLFQVSY